MHSDEKLGTEALCADKMELKIDHTFNHGTRAVQLFLLI